MPGLTLLHDAIAASPSPDAGGDALTGAAGADGIDVRLLHCGPRLAVVVASYPDYPVETVEGSGIRVVLEGRIYHARPGPHERDLLRLARALLAGADVEATAARWLVGLDGEFVLAAIDTATDAAVVVNDRHGRLPLHHGAAAGRTVVSRDPRLAAELLARPELSRTAIAHFLLFGHPLGTDTLFRAVERTPPGSVLEVPGGRCRTLLQRDLEACAGAGADPARVPEALADALVDACARRAAAGRPAVVSLSGGIDSRLVAGALVRAGVHPVAATHVDADGVEAREAEAAGAVARTLGIPWRAFVAHPPTGAEVARLLRLKGGANYLGMSRVLPFLDAVAGWYGRASVFFTGDLGDRILGPVAPPAPLRDAAGIAAYLLRREAILPLRDVAAATGVPARVLVDELVARIEAYPERRGDLRYLRFMLAERGMRWGFEGEDRNRCWFWSTTPFFAPEVFERAMVVPPAAKALHRLRVRTLERLAPALAEIPDVATRARVTSPTFRLRLRARRLVRGTAYRVLGAAGEASLRRLLGRTPGYGEASPVLGLVREQLAHPAVGAYLEPAAVTRILARARRVPREQFSVVYTVTSLIQAVEPGADRILERCSALRFV